MEYYSSVKNNWSPDACYNVEEPGKHYAQWKKSDTKGHKLYDSISMKCSE